MTSVAVYDIFTWFWFLLCWLALHDVCSDICAPWCLFWSRLWLSL
jgi:hypothetical protein